MLSKYQYPAVAKWRSGAQRHPEQPGVAHAAVDGIGPVVVGDGDHQAAQRLLLVRRLPAPDICRRYATSIIALVTLADAVSPSRRIAVQPPPKSTISANDGCPPAPGYEATGSANAGAGREGRPLFGLDRDGSFRGGHADRLGVRRSDVVSGHGNEGGHAQRHDRPACPDPTAAVAGVGSRAPVAAAGSAWRATSL